MRYGRGFAISASRFFLVTSALAALLLPVSMSNMRRERDYRSLASILLRLATDPPRTTENLAEGCPEPSSDGHRVLVGRIVDCDQMFFLAEESTPHAYILTNISLAKTFLGRKVRIKGALQSSHVLAVETVDELN